MSLTTIAIGLDSIVDGSIKDIYATPPNPADVVNVRLKAATGTLPFGQMLSLQSIDSDGQIFEAVANAAAFQALTVQAGVLLKGITQAGNQVYAPVQVKGNFIQDKLTPADVPPGAYGNIIIEKEV